MKRKTNKLPKLRDFTCVICRTPFQRHLAPADIKAGRGKVCSKLCKSILNGIQKSRGHFRNCVKCKQQFWHKPSHDRRGYTNKYCSRKCHGSEKKLRKMSTDGYWVVHVPLSRLSFKNEMKEHRWIMEQHLNRKLLPTEIVHHINHDKLDNRLENLQVVSRSEHNKIHGFLKK